MPTVRLFRPGDAPVVVRRHGELYARELGWNEEFERHVAGIVSDFESSGDPGRTRGWIAEEEGRFAGCVFLMKQDAERARLRLLLVEPWARGQGLGTRLVGLCVDFARDAGYSQLSLWTNSVLTPARHLYERLGFHKVSEEAHHSFGRDLVGETWALDLPRPRR